MLLALAAVAGCSTESEPTFTARTDPPPQLGFTTRMEVEDIWLICPECEKTVRDVLAKIDGLKSIQCDLDSRKVRFEARNTETAEVACQALHAAGFGGVFHYKDIASNTAGLIAARPQMRGKPKEVVTIKGVHVCCQDCEDAIRGLFKDAVVTFDGKGPQKDLLVTGKALTTAEVWDTLVREGLWGTFEIEEDSRDTRVEIHTGPARVRE
jgi:copper chaperone CopZ